MNLKHHFEIPTDRDTAWTVLLDIPRIAPCMPGAELTEVVDERTYKGRARVKVGPISLQFAGEAEIVELDDTAHNAVVHAKGSDGKGRGTADATVRFSLSSESKQTTRVDVETDLNLTGAVAQYGRASGLIDAVAQQIIAEFVKNLNDELAKSTPETAGPVSDGNTEAVSPEGASPAAAAPPRPATPVSGLSLLFRAIAAMVAGWFKKSDETSTTDKKP